MDLAKLNREGVNFNVQTDLRALVFDTEPTQFSFTEAWSPTSNDDDGEDAESAKPTGSDQEGDEDDAESSGSSTLFSDDDVIMPQSKRRRIVPVEQPAADVFNDLSKTKMFFLASTRPLPRPRFDPRRTFARNKSPEAIVQEWESKRKELTSAYKRAHREAQRQSARRSRNKSYQRKASS
ncbi:hypothetical protein SeMB42_g00701 [Synchytrium endobioticum]|uniref:Uncharacterized protein n=1 Tax=Synchytrium endobioticum TaxID=286115 RepID=A0A507DQD5_9FUNG|nr:hypothetical protein SeLEV6574_g02135 [Synchytrium endobioticum]TPX53601.1 hypothetical protein SeMB42_g00701 [Synchytrium endobioticum]